MKRILLIAGAALALSACDRIPQKVGEEVRGVEIADGGRVDDMAGELHVTIREIESGQSWDVNLGEECSQYPLPMGQKFLARFDKMAAKATPQNVSVEPNQQMLWNYLCG
jgi:hypothetical protein